MSEEAPMCIFCKHFHKTESRHSKIVCDAFPKGIPEEIFSYHYDHRLPFPNDNGIRLEPDPKKFPDEAEFNKMADKCSTKMMPDVVKIENSKKELIELGISPVLT